jgi:hypothetical protein
MEEDLTDEELRELTRSKQQEIRQEEGKPPGKVEREVRRPSREKEEYEEWKREREKTRQFAKREKQRKAPGRGKDKNRPKAKKREYLFDIMPRWLPNSGLPRLFYKKYGHYAWPIFSCLISLDCRFNPDDPDWFDQSYREIAELTGVCLRTVRNIINKLEKAGYLSVIRGEFKGLKSSFKISDSLPTPKGPNSIKAVNGGFLGRKGKEPNLRYYQRGQPLPPLDQKERG